MPVNFNDPFSDYTVAYVLIKTNPGKESTVAEQITNLYDTTEDTGPVWATVVTGDYNVIVALRQYDEDEIWVKVEEIHGIEGVREVHTCISSQYWQTGQSINTMTKLVNGLP